MIQITRKDPKEPLENMLRRFSRKVSQSGILANAKANQYFEKPISKSERRTQAIIRNKRRAVKNQNQRSNSR